MKRTYALLSIAVMLMACKSETKKEETKPEATQETAAAEENEWIYLFDGSTTEGWRSYNGEALPPQWVIEDDVLTFDTEKRTEANKKGGNDIIYAAEEFDNFELAWEWKIPEGGNSGMLYHIKEGDWGMPETSPEYQMLDDLKWEEINNAKLEEWQKTGADYAMYVPDVSQKITKPAGEWNTSRVIFTPEKVEHWLNGKKLLSFVPWSEDWEKRKSEGKWKDSPKYGTFKTGYIGFQDHDSPLWLKNIKIKRL
ncbi:MAG: glycosyl hydrolase [Pseudozobellia sp.]|nr:glycosyl hydrolase [Pseudozobellia sp.]|tara:strand:- start:59 stop:817 length:759 start_codon:yes stop_codon:yes gene_type:complete